ncbi:uncharacterized protein BXZ73DRAFT_51832 [Epithele typhae]|uniref:uncharacterized protein n=1 Tax=Epithele typhae TaxID=378194 RepID=UPI002007B9DB|nr:uncharacterized protein BXZ73DRAFT_51832 [Epithele typhae]KAH9921533.1 hypothetical protein BXZ73DRAFT_51832 [Epithele typhae]
MNVSVDDLISSFGQSHIGQEANDLAAFRAQLAQSLLAQPMTSSRAGPLNSPVRSPSASISLDPAQAAWLRHTSASGSKMRCSIDENQQDPDEMMDEDERMVEDLLLASPSSPAPAPPAFARPQLSSPPSYRQRKTSLSVTMIPLDHAHHEPSISNASIFTTTDPFYLASIQGTHSHPSPASVFSQAGRPASHSPFLKHHMQSAYQPFGNAYQAVPPEAQPYMFAATATATTYSL